MQKEKNELPREKTNNLHIGKNKGADQLRGYCEADQRLCFPYMDITLTLLLKSEISNFKPVSVTAQTGFVSDLFKNHIVGFPHEVTQIVRDPGHVTVASWPPGL